MEVGGVEDHVHLLARFGRSLPQSEWVKEVKRVSSAWAKGRGREYDEFAWQGGYATFSVSASGLDAVVSYIRDQEAHHRKISFQEELRTLLRRYRMEWDERYIWD